MTIQSFQSRATFILESGGFDARLTRKSESSLFKQDSSPNLYGYRFFECLAIALLDEFETIQNRASKLLTLGFLLIARFKQ